MKPLSKEAEQRVLEAIQRTCDLVSSEQTPTAALSKVAAEMQLGPHLVKLAAYGYNAGAVTHQRESRSGILEKLAAVPLVDPDAILAQLYPPSLATPAETKSAQDVSAEYRRPPQLPARPRQGMAKEAYDRVAAQLKVELPPAPPGDPKIKMAKAFGQADTQRRKLAEARQAYVEVQDRLLSLVGQLGSYLKQGRYDAQYSPAEIREALTSRFGKVGSALYQAALVSGRAQEYERDGRRPVDWQAAPFRIAQAALDAGRELTLRKQAYLDTEIQTTQRIRALTEPWTTRPADPPPATAPHVLGKEAARRKASSFLGAALGGGLMRAVSGTSAAKPTSELANDLFLKLDDPRQEDELRSIQARAMLQDLLQNDEVISGYDPEQVYSAFNELATTMPRSATQPTIVRGLLRKRLSQGALEPFEAAEMANIEKTLAQSQSSKIDPLAKQATHVLGRTSRILMRR